MKNFLNKFYAIIDKIGKRNFILLTFILFFLVVSGLYATFSLYTSSEGVDIVNGIKTYKFILNSENDTNIVTIAAGSSKHIAVTVSNYEEFELMYGIYYSSTQDLSDVDIGYARDTEYLPNGVIEGESDYVVTIQVDNNSDSDISITFGITYGFEKSGNLILEGDQQWLDQKWNFPLTEVEVGSYVKFIGNNGCSGVDCYGQNENYVDDTDMGYCVDETYKFTVNGWRIAYKGQNNAYLVTAGAPECMCTKSDGTASDSDCADDYETTIGAPLHLANLSSHSQLYCNKAFNDQNVCDSSSVWNIGENDMKKISHQSLANCWAVSSGDCGLENTLLDNGSYYWFNKAYSTSNAHVFVWSPESIAVSSGYPFNVNGVRPIMKLDSSIVVVNGTGTYEDPYIIDNFNTVKDLSGNMKNGVDFGGTVWDQDSGELTTDGSTGYVDCGMINYEFGDKISVVTRVKFNEVKGSSIIGNWESAGWGISLSTENRILSFTVYIDSGYRIFRTSFVPTAETWYTFVGVYDGANLSVYVDGSALSLNTSISDAVDTASGSIKASPVPVALGANLNISVADAGYANVVYSDVLVFTRALTTSEITSDYAEEVSPSNFEDLVLYYDFKR